MPADPKREARAFIDGALAKQKQLGYRSRISKASYERAVRHAEAVFRTMARTTDADRPPR